MTDLVFLYIISLVIVIKNIKDICFSALFTAVMVVLSLIYIPLIVPITLQTFAVFLSLLVLGEKKGTASVTAYILLGLVGLPVFSGFRSGLNVLLSPTGGYILGLLLICFIFAVLNRAFKGKFKNLSLIIGLICCYIIGSLWYMIFTGADSFFAVLTVTVLPFIIPDIIKLFLAYIIAKRIKGRTF